MPTFNISQDVAGNYGLIDNLTYSYNDKNQVTKIIDNSGYNAKGFRYANSGHSQDYTYDDNGNLIADKNKNISKIEYNYLNLPQRIEFIFSSENKLGVIEFVYDATGAKLRKIVTQTCLNPAAPCAPTLSTTYDYVNGVEYKNGNLERVAHSEGSISKNVNTGTFEMEYVLRDHLGNSRVTFSDSDNDGIVTSADIKQINHYYPFGLNMEGNWNGANGNNKYQYNNKEWNDDFGLGWNHHDWRFYDVAMNRFVTIDRLPEEQEQEQLAPYHFSYDNPIIYSDPDGQCPTCLTALAGAVVGGLIEVGSQLLENGGDFSKVDMVDVGVEIVKGAAIGSGAGLIGKRVLDYGGEAVKASFDYTTSEGNKNIFNDKKAPGRALTDFAVNMAGGKLADKGAGVLKKAASNASEKATVATQRANISRRWANEAANSGNSVRAKGAANLAKADNKTAARARTQSKALNATSKVIRSKPAQVVRGATLNRVSNKIKDKLPPE